jgi:hypothetical protein
MENLPSLFAPLGMRFWGSCFQDSCLAQGFAALLARQMCGEPAQLRAASQGTSRPRTPTALISSSPRHASENLAI